MEGYTQTELFECNRLRSQEALGGNDENPELRLLRPLRSKVKVLVKPETSLMSRKMLKKTNYLT
jgi:hypothetical protein